jgi:hypothetical protein
VRISWADLHSALVRALVTAEAVEQYRRLCAEWHVLARFPSAPALLEHLALPSRHLDSIDQIYAVLVRTVQARARAARTAHALLMCGLWPGLDRIYRRRRSQFRDRADELPVALSGTFTLLVGQLDLRTVHRVAATLVRSTAREIASAARRSRVGTEISLEELEELEELPAPAVNDEVFRYELATLHRVLRPIVGEDTELVLRVLVLEERQSTAAARLGLTLHTARKRFQRAIRRLRDIAQKSSTDMQLSTPSLANRGLSIFNSFCTGQC